MITISVIVPCYNSIEKMDKCLDSFLNQSFQNFEVIFVDDCSTDNTAGKLERWCKDSGIYASVICLDENKGPGNARNIGIQQATGNYICFCDADDWYEYDYLEKMYEVASKESADLVMCNYRQVLTNGTIRNVNYLDAIKNKNDIKECLINTKFSLCLLMVKASIMKSIRIPDLYNGEDMATVPLVIIRSKKIGIQKAVLYNYFFHNNSASNTVKKTTYYSMLKVFEYLESMWPEGFYEDEKIYLGIKDIIYGAMLNGVKSGVPRKVMKQDINRFERKYQKWWKNRYYRKLNIRYRVFMFFARRKCFFIMKIYGYLHMKISVK